MSGVIFFVVVTFTLTVFYHCVIASMVFGEFDKLNKRLDKMEHEEEP